MIKAVNKPATSAAAGLLVGLLGFIATSVANSEEPPSQLKIGSLVNLEQPLTSPLFRSHKRVVWPRCLRHRQAIKYIRMQVTFIALGVGPWKLRFEGSRFAISADQVAKRIVPFHIWTPLLPTRGSCIVAEGVLRGVQFQIKRLILGEVPSKPQVIIHPDDRVPISSYRGRRVYNWGKNVAFLRLLRDEPWSRMDAGEFGCTGFLATPTLLFTSDHCLGDERYLNSSITASFDEDTGKQVRVETEPLLRQRERDFAVLRMSAKVPHAKGLRVSETGPTVDLATLVIQSPYDATKEESNKLVVEKNCKVLSRIHEALFRHTCDIVNTGSGSPIFDQRHGLVVGIHSIGVESKQYNAASGSHHIMSWIAKAKPTLYRSILEGQQ